MKKKETEVKIELTKEEFDNLSKGTKCDFERTYGFFKQDMSNIQEGIFPRIKHIVGKHALLTVKLRTTENIQFFERHEIEGEITENQVSLMREILKATGFSKEIIFEKKRENFEQHECKIALDELPFGYFIEIEGESDKIENAIKKLELQNKERITVAYLKLWEKVNLQKMKHCTFN